MQSSKVQGPTWALLVLFVSLFLLRGIAPAQEDAKATWRVWLEPRFMRAAVTAPVAGAEKTEYAAGELADGELQAWSKERFQNAASSWEEFAAVARQNAATDLVDLKPEYVRNRQKVIEYAVIRSEKPILASAVLAPGFL